MSDLTTPLSREIDQNEVQKLALIAGQLQPWLMFLGIANMFIGSILILSIVGMFIGIPTLWLGIVLYQASNRAALAGKTGSGEAIAKLLYKLKSYFVITATLLIITLAFTITGIYFVSDYFSLLFDFMMM
jgi:hypothetical protein